MQEKSTRRPTLRALLGLKNEPEHNLEELASKNGWRPTKRGWPDFLCFSEATGEVVAVEVKPRTKSGRLQRLKRDQATCMDVLKGHGIRCFVSDGLTLEPYDRETHFDFWDHRPTK